MKERPKKSARNEANKPDRRARMLILPAIGDTDPIR
jgi:hypothetical protein